MYCYKGTSITGERCVNPHKTQLNDALIEPYTADFIRSLYPPVRETEGGS